MLLGTVLTQGTDEEGSSTATPADSDDQWKWEYCQASSECRDGWICCSATARKDGSDPPVGTHFCTDPEVEGVVPAGSETRFAGYKYFCSHK